MKFIVTVSSSLIAGLFLVTLPADAAQVFLDAAAGHPHQSFGTTKWKNQFTDNAFNVQDGKSISISDIDTGTTTRTWVIHIPITGTNQSWSSMAQGQGGSACCGTLQQRICTFTPNGIFLFCGDTVNFGVDSTALVTTDGTAYSQTFLTHNGPGSGPLLAMIKAHN